MFSARRRLWIVFALAALTAGCAPPASAPPPATHPVKGRLLDTAGQPVTSGMIQIVTSDAIPKSATGEIRSDGSFELATMNDRGEKFPGAEPGQYSATYIPAMSAAQTEQPVSLTQPVTIEARENMLELRLP
jgi:hypothetical protein